MSTHGALRFGRYAFQPNRRGYCGPPDFEALLHYVSTEHVDGGLLALERQFEGAYPYLVLIARANGLSDPFDDRVVDAYWIGNGFLDRVEPSPFYRSLQERFAPRMPQTEFRWLTAGLQHAARPHHNFHVFDVSRRAGSMRGEQYGLSVEWMDACRVSWGQVVAIDLGHVTVRRRPLTLTHGRLALGPEDTTRVESQLNGQGFVNSIKLGDTVSIHWSWACERLTPSAQSRLEASTRKYLALANQTL